MRLIIKTIISAFSRDYNLVFQHITCFMILIIQKGDDYQYNTSWKPLTLNNVNE